MEYLLLIYDDEKFWHERDDADRVAIMQAYNTYTKSLQDAGVLKGGNALLPVASATTVRVRSNERITTDGPFTACWSRCAPPVSSNSTKPLQLP